MKNRLLAIALTVFTLVSTFSGNHFVFAQESEEETSTTMTLDENGDIEINRRSVGNTPMGEEGTWTIFVYLCGADLESGNANNSGGDASSDLKDMIEANTKENIKFIVQTGGAKKWTNASVDAGKIERWEICNGEMKKVYTGKKYTSMGDASTLSSFLEWGVEKYPASKMGVAFFDHGGGCIYGACFDEKKGNDSLYLSEIDEALKKASKKMTDKFEFIGFDACLMGTIEVANVLSPYARYMIASEEVEYSPGWDFKALGKYLDEKPNANGKEVGQSIVKSYFKCMRKLRKYGYNDMTLSVLDLSELDELITAYNVYSRNLSAVLADSNVFADFAQNIVKVDSFGCESPEEGYHNLVDLWGVVKAAEDFVDGEDEVYDAINNVVVCYANESKKENSCGISVYYPLGYGGEAELQTFKSLCVSPYYYAIVRRIHYGQENKGNMKGYDEKTFINSWMSAQKEAGKSYYEPEWQGSDLVQDGEDSELVEYNVLPSIYDGWEFWNGSIDTGDYLKNKQYRSGKYYGFIPTSKSEKNITDVRLRGYVKSADGRYWIDLGEKSFKKFGKQFGYAVDLDQPQFYFLPLKNESSITGISYQPVARYLVEVPKDIKNINYYTLLSVNGVDKTVPIERKEKLSDIATNYTEDGLIEREKEVISDGETVCLFYKAIDCRNGEIINLYSDAFSYKKRMQLEIPKVDEEHQLTYFYYFDITDSFGNHTYTEPVYCIPGVKYWK